MSEPLLRTPDKTTPKSNLSVNTIPDVKTMNLSEYIKVVDEEETLRRERETEEAEEDDDEEEEDNYDKGDDIGAFKVPIVRTYSLTRPESPRRPSSRTSGSFDDSSKKNRKSPDSPSNMDLFVP